MIISHFYYFLCDGSRILLSPSPQERLGHWVYVANDDTYNMVLRFPARDRPSQILSSAITKYLTKGGAHHRSPHVHKKGKCCGIWTGDTGHPLTSLGRILNHSPRGRNGPLIVYYLHHSIRSQLERTNSWRKSLIRS